MTFSLRHRGISAVLLAIGAAVAAALIAAGVPTARADLIPAVPSGTTAYALDGDAGIAWKPVSGATSYAVFRGTAANSITQQVSPAGLSATSFEDSTAVNDQTY